MDEAIAILKLCSLDWDDLTVHALYDGDRVEPWETVMTIEGDYTLFAHLETVYLGVLARRTLITTNVVRVLEAGERQADHLHARAARPPPRPDRRRLRGVRRGRIVGVPVGVTTDEQASWWGGKGVGTVPHSLIAAYGGNTVLAATKFAEWAPRGPERDRARRLRERLGADGARGRARARAAALGRPARHVGDARRPLAVGGAGRLQADAASTSGSCGRCATRSTRDGFERVQDRRLRRVRRGEDPRVRGDAACRSTRTASARR